MTNIRAKKWTRHTTILYFIQKLLLQIDAKMEEVVTGDGVIWPIGTLVLTCSHCDASFGCSSFRAL